MSHFPPHYRLMVHILITLPVWSYSPGWILRPQSLNGEQWSCMTQVFTAEIDRQSGRCLLGETDYLCWAEGKAFPLVGGRATFFWGKRKTIGGKFWSGVWWWHSPPREMIIHIPAWILSGWSMAWLEDQRLLRHSSEQHDNHTLSVFVCLQNKAVFTLQGSSGQNSDCFSSQALVTIYV